MAATLCLTDPGSLLEPFSRHPALKPSRSEPEGTPNTPRDRVPINKTSSRQWHSQMGVSMQGCRSYAGPDPGRTVDLLSTGCAETSHDDLIHPDLLCRSRVEP